MVPLLGYCSAVASVALHEKFGMKKQGVWAVASSRRVVITSLKVSLVVGTILALINHGDGILQMSLTRESLLKILLTYMVPYGVSTYSAVKTTFGIESSENES